MTPPPPPAPPRDADAGRRFRRTLLRVMSVQVATLVALWLLQQHFSR